MLAFSGIDPARCEFIANEPESGDVPLG